MATARDIIARLTEPQYQMLAQAVASLANEIEQGDVGTQRDLAVLNRGWDSVRTAWHRAGDGF